MSTTAAYFAGIFTVLIGLPAMVAVAFLYAIIWRVPGGRPVGRVIC